MSRLLSSPSAIRVSINDDKEPLNTNYLSFAERDERDFCESHCLATQAELENAIN